jgi:phage replication-related protein YjqB (UPF0714/DUF867 family)
MADKYGNFDELRRGERNGIDFRVSLTKTNTSVAIIAPHGGWIEPGTSEIAAAVAGGDYNLYCFEGLRNRPHGDLHVTSHQFNEPSCVELVGGCDQVVALHGRAGAERCVEVGGLDIDLRDAIRANLVAAGFEAEVVTTGELAALHPRNICNRGARNMGCQLEITRALRDALRADSDLLDRFAQAVRRAL